MRTLAKGTSWSIHIDAESQSGHYNSCPHEDMSYNVHSGFPHQYEYSSWFLWPMFSFQVYPGNVLNTYHWRAVDADHVVVWRGWYSVGGIAIPPTEYHPRHTTT